MQLAMAAYGWQGDEWSAAYPGDLPSEWRLDYYSNQYDALLVPSDDWVREEDNTLQDWLAETPEGFSLYWELSGDADARRLLDLYQNTAAAPAGWVLGADIGLSAELAEELRDTASLLVGKDKSEWRGDGVGMLAVEAEAELRAVRESIDLRAEQGLKRLVLLVSASPRAAQQMEQLHTLCQLYGG